MSERGGVAGRAGSSSSGTICGKLFFLASLWVTRGASATGVGFGIAKLVDEDEETPVRIGWMAGMTGLLVSPYMECRTGRTGIALSIGGGDGCCEPGHRSSTLAFFCTGGWAFSAAPGEV
jgi:hypothetical protein